MTNQEKINYKLFLKQFCTKVLEERIAVTKHNIQEAQDAANSEEKSSAGDKYETGRAMGHLQKDIYARQLSECLKELSALRLIKVDAIHDAIQSGTFFTAGSYHFFIAIGLGKQQVGNEIVFFVGANSPIALKLLHKKKGDEFILKEEKLVIENLY